jgi:hypothetical protein
VKGRPLDEHRRYLPPTEGEALRFLGGQPPLGGYSVGSRCLWRLPIVNGLSFPRLVAVSSATLRSVKDVGGGDGDLMEVVTGGLCNGRLGQAESPYEGVRTEALILHAHTHAGRGQPIRS